MPWSAAFEDPIPLPGRRQLRTLQQAADHIMALPDDVQHAPQWQTAIEVLIKAAEDGGGWLFFARIAMLRALNADAQRAGGRHHR